MALPISRLLNAMYAWLLSRVGDREETRRMLAGLPPLPKPEDTPTSSAPAAPTRLRPTRHTEEEEAAAFGQFIASTA